jgi:hypothetical protein
MHGPQDLLGISCIMLQYLYQLVRFCYLFSQISRHQQEEVMLIFIIIMKYLSFFSVFTPFVHNLKHNVIN